MSATGSIGRLVLCVGLLALLCGSCWGEEEVLPFLPLGSVEGVPVHQMPIADEELSPSICIHGGFPMGHTTFSSAYVCTNGYISIGSQHLSYIPFHLFKFNNKGLVAPFFFDVDLNNGGNITYETHTSGPLLEVLSAFVSRRRGIDFNARWMLLVYWDKVAPYHEGEIPHPVPRNTFQAILLTDGTQSYAVFTYKCGQMNYATKAGIGFVVRKRYDIYDYHPLSRTYSARDVACLNAPRSPWSNLVYQLTLDPKEGSGDEESGDWNSDQTMIDDEEYTANNGDEGSGGQETSGEVDQTYTVIGI